MTSTLSSMSTLGALDVLSASMRPRFFPELCNTTWPISFILLPWCLMEPCKKRVSWAPRGSPAKKNRTYLAGDHDEAAYHVPREVHAAHPLKFHGEAHFCCLDIENGVRGKKVWSERLET